jgi:hypothetical protein
MRKKNTKMKKQMQQISDHAARNQIPVTYAIFWQQKPGFYEKGTVEHT